MSSLLIVTAAVSSTEIVDGVALRVNDRIVTVSEYRLRLAERIQVIGQSELPEADRDQALAEAPQAVLDEIERELLLLSRADQIGLSASEAEIARSVEGVRSRMGVETEDEFRLALAQSRMTVDDLRRRMEDNILVQKVIGNEVQPRVEIEEEELRRLYRDHPDQFRRAEAREIREVVVLEEERSLAEQMSIASEIRDRVEAGEGLEVVASEFSERGETTDLIELGWVEADELAADLVEAVWPLEEGELSEPVAGRGGLHVVEVVHRREAELVPFEEIQSRLYASEQQRQFDNELIEYLGELAAVAYVDRGPVIRATADLGPLVGEGGGPVPDFAAAAQAAAGDALAAEEAEEAEDAVGDGSVDPPEAPSSESEPQPPG